MYFVVAIFTLLPFISWFWQYYFSRKNGLLDSFQKHWMCYRGDWIFIPINALFFFSVQISSLLSLLIIPAILLNLFPHLLWGYENKKKRLRLHFYLPNTARLNGAGIIHFVFSVIQTTVFLWIIFLIPIIPYIFWILFFMVLFSLVLMYCSYRMHGRVTYDDIIVWSSVILLIAFKVLLLMTIL